VSILLPISSLSYDGSCCSAIASHHALPSPHSNTVVGQALTIDRRGLNGHHVDDMDAEDDLGNEELTPPPDTPPSASLDSFSPVAEPMTRDPSVLVNALEDEIVVGTNANKKLLHKDSPLRIVSEPDDVDMDDIEQESVASQKRKRTSTYIETPDEGNSPAPRSELPDSRPRPSRPAKTGAGVKGVLLGYWRDSEPEKIADKHAVIGFIDVRDRLRTRIQPTTRDGRNIVNEYPLPPGPGGSWVTFQQVAFDEHLVFLNQHQVKDYVKIRLETLTEDETPEQKDEKDRAAVKAACRKSESSPSIPYTTEPLVAYGPEIPEHAQPQSRPEAKKRRITQQPILGISQAVPAGAFTQHHPIDALPGTRPTRILLGHWKLSSSLEAIDKHAVYGILGANDMFRVKLMRETRDGRPLVGNFPQGAGALWIHWDEVIFEPHLQNLSRPEIKEYCRVRQRQLDEGETDANRVENETKAVYEAQKRVVSGSVSTTAKYQEYPVAPMPLAMKAPVTNGTGHDESLYENGLPAADGLPHIEPRQSRQLPQIPQAPRARHSLSEVELRAANRPPAGPSPLERTNSIARREIARVEAAAQRAEQRNEQRGRETYSASPAAHIASAGVPANKILFDENISRLNKIWATQEASRLKVDSEDAKMYMGIKYERKKNGPFEGKLVSQGTIISIDGEDYVEYRVLTKPSFF